MAVITSECAAAGGGGRSRRASMEPGGMAGGPALFNRQELARYCPLLSTSLSVLLLLSSLSLSLLPLSPLIPLLPAFPYLSSISSPLYLCLPYLLPVPPGTQRQHASSYQSSPAGYVEFESRVTQVGGRNRRAVGRRAVAGAGASLPHRRCLKMRCDLYPGRRTTHFATAAAR